MHYEVLIRRQNCWCGGHPSVAVLTHFSKRLSWSHIWPFLYFAASMVQKEVLYKPHIWLSEQYFLFFFSLCHGGQHEQSWSLEVSFFLLFVMPLYEIWHQNMKGGDCGDWFVPFLLPSDVDEEALSEREEAGRTDVAVPLIMRKRRWGLASLKRTGIQCANILIP